MATATQQFANTLDTYCTGSNICYIYTYSNGGAVFSRTVALYPAGRWNIGYSVPLRAMKAAARSVGTGWVGEIFGGCYLAGHIGPSDHRNGWNHNVTNSVTVGMIGGNGWLAPYAQSSVLPGHDDGAVAEHSSGGYSSSGSFSNICGGGKFAAPPSVVVVRVRQPQPLRSEDEGDMQRRRRLRLRELTIAIVLALVAAGVDLAPPPR